MQSLREISGIVDVRQDWENRVVRIKVKVDQARARRAGVTSRDVANSLNALISGAEVTEYREGDQAIPIILRGTEAERTNAVISGMNIYSSARGTSVPLEQIAGLSFRRDGRIHHNPNRSLGQVRDDLYPDRRLDHLTSRRSITARPSAQRDRSMAHGGTGRLSTSDRERILSLVDGYGLPRILREKIPAWG